MVVSELVFLNTFLCTGKPHYNSCSATIISYNNINFLLLIKFIDEQIPTSSNTLDLIANNPVWYYTKAQCDQKVVQSSTELMCIFQEIPFFFIMISTLKFFLWCVVSQIHSGRMIMFLVYLNGWALFIRCFCTYFYFLAVNSWLLEIKANDAKCDALMYVYWAQNDVWLYVCVLCECGPASKRLCVCLLLGIQFHLPSSGSVDRPSQQPPGKL